MNEQQTILHLEELSVNAWPSLQTMCYDGWILRFAEGYTRRANSVLPMYPSSIDPLEKIKECERLYASKGQRCIFKMTAIVQPDSLDAVLAEEGYAREASTGVRTVSLRDVPLPSERTGLVEAHLSDGWLADFCCLNSVDVRRLPIMASMLSNLVPARGFFSLRHSSETVAVGLAVLERGWVGLFDVVTAPDLRNQGLGTQLVSQMLAWGKANGASHAYLQVVHENAPALHLYDKLGFREVYSYSYRVRRG